MASVRTSRRCQGGYRFRRNLQEGAIESAKARGWWFEKSFRNPPPYLSHLGPTVLKAQPASLLLPDYSLLLLRLGSLSGEFPDSRAFRFPVEGSVILPSGCLPEPFSLLLLSNGKDQKDFLLVL